MKVFICDESYKKSANVMFSCVEGEIRLNTTDIVMIETAGHKNIIQLKDAKYQIYETLENLGRQLKEYGFLRIHKSFLVNMAYIRSINNYILTLDDGRQFSVPKGRYKCVKQELASYVGKNTD